MTAGSTDALRIRMYNVGFGDCFLLFVPTVQGARTMLLDCGKHMSSKTGHTISEAAEDIVKTVSTAGTPRIDVVVASHRHYDHISGYDLEAVGSGRGRRGLDAVDGGGRQSCGGQDSAQPEPLGARAGPPVRIDRRPRSALSRLIRCPTGR